MWERARGDRVEGVDDAGEGGTDAAARGVRRDNHRHMRQRTGEHKRITRRILVRLNRRTQQAARLFAVAKKRR